MAAYCLNCGNALPIDNAKFCPNCGAAQQEGAPASGTLSEKVKSRQMPSVTDAVYKCPKCSGTGKLGLGRECDYCFGGGRIGPQKQEEWRKQQEEKRKTQTAQVWQAVGCAIFIILGIFIFFLWSASF